MRNEETLTLTRDCQAAQIPSGSPVLLPAGMRVQITQSLGGSYTVMTESGYMVRIDDQDADALGKEVSKANPSSEAPLSGEALEKKVWDVLRSCYDPEIPINIADLGLIYSCRITPLAEGGNQVDIQMTLTAPGCGMGTVLSAEVQSKVMRLPGVKECRVELVWQPQWNQSMMSEAAKLQLGLM